MNAPRHVLVARTDSDGDVLLSGPAVRAVAAHARVTMLVSPAGAAAARLLPGVDDVLVADVPWSGYRPAPVDPPAVDALVENLHAARLDAAVVLTSWHQSPLPAALLLKLAGVAHVAAASEDYPGSLLDLRFRADRTAPGQVHEVEAMLALVRAAGFEPAEQGAAATRLAVRRPLPPLPAGLPSDLPEGPAGPAGYVVVHPGASVPARTPHPADAARIVAELAARGRSVVVTGGPGEHALTAQVAAGAPRGAAVVDLGGRTDLPTLAAVLEHAACVVVGNTGPAHLAAAVGTPVVSLFAPVVPLERWRPWGVPVRVLGDPSAPCRGTGARTCPVPGHPCLSLIRPAAVADAVDDLTAGRPGSTRRPARDPRRALPA